jgi:hypothetical protein
MVFLLEGLTGLGVAFLLGVALAEWAKFRVKAERGFNWIALAGVWFIFAGSLQVSSLGNFIGAGTAAGIGSIFDVAGWIFALIGTLFVFYEVIVER